jgi:ATP-dependent Lhr-like helicase
MNADGGNLPEDRLSKFQVALPEIYSLEIIRNYLLNIPRTSRFLKLKSYI